MKLTQIMNENQENRPLSNEVKKHFLEIVSTYNKYQEMMDRKSDLATVAETLGGITEAARTLAIHEGDDWFDKQTIKRNMSELDKLGKEFDKVAVEATSLDQRLNGLYEDMGHILSRYYKMGEITEEQMKERLGMNESVGCGCGGTTESTCGCGTHTHESVNEDIEPQTKKIASLTGTRPDAVKQFVSKNALNITKLLKFIEKGKLSDRMDFVSALAGKSGNPIEKKVIKMFQESVNEEEELTKFGESVEKLMEKNVPTNPSKWSYYKAQAKKKFDVYPSAYANGWAAKQYKAAGGGWKKGKSESVNEISIPQLAKKDAEHLERHVGGKSEKEVRAFVDRVYKFYPKDVRKYMADAFIHYQRGNVSFKYFTTVLRVMHQDIRESVNESVNEAKFGYKDSTASYINKHKDEYKQAEKMNNGNEKKFYDMLQQMEEKVGHGKTMLFISNSLRGYGVDMFKDPKIKNPQDAQEALFLLSK